MNKSFVGIGFLIIFSFLLMRSAFGQIGSKDNYYFRDFEKKPFYFGIQLGVASSGYKMEPSQAFYKEDSLYRMESPLNPGFTVSLIANLKIGEYFDFRSTPGFIFTERSFDFYNNQNEKIVKRNETYTIDVPLLLRFKSSPYKDKRLFVLAGVKYEYNFSNNNNLNGILANQILEVSPHDFQYIIGAGIQFFLPYIIFSPQLTYSRGISNIHISKNKLTESRIIDQIFSRIFSLTINLEG